MIAETKTIDGSGKALLLADRITPGQIRAARGFLDWSIVDLATAARVSVSTIKRAEAEVSQHDNQRSLAAIAQALQAAGVTFLADDGTGPGVRCDGTRLFLDRAAALGSRAS